MSAIAARSSEPSYAPAEIRDREYNVTATRDGGHDLDGQLLPAHRVGAGGVTAVVFYTGFAGCPPRYYVTRNGMTFEHRDAGGRA